MHSACPRLNMTKSTRIITNGVCIFQNIDFRIIFDFHFFANIKIFRFEFLSSTHFLVVNSAKIKANFRPDTSLGKILPIRFSLDMFYTFDVKLSGHFYVHLKTPLSLASFTSVGAKEVDIILFFLFIRFVFLQNRNSYFSEKRTPTW